MRKNWRRTARRDERNGGGGHTDRRRRHRRPVGGHRAELAWPLGHRLRAGHADRGGRCGHQLLPGGGPLPQGPGPGRRVRRPRAGRRHRDVQPALHDAGWPHHRRGATRPRGWPPGEAVLHPPGEVALGAAQARDGASGRGPAARGPPPRALRAGRARRDRPLHFAWHDRRARVPRRRAHRRRRRQVDGARAALPEARPHVHGLDHLARDVRARRQLARRAHDVARRPRLCGVGALPRLGEGAPRRQVPVQLGAEHQVPRARPRRELDERRVEGRLASSGARLDPRLQRAHAAADDREDGADHGVGPLRPRPGAPLVVRTRHAARRRGAPAAAVRLAGRVSSRP